MTIGKKLYFGFGAILVMLVIQFVINFMAVRREQDTRAAYEASLAVLRKTSAVRFQMMQNRLFLRNFLLSGDGRELEKLRDGTFRLQQLFPTLSEAVAEEQKQIVANTLQVEQDWSEKFAGPLIEKRKQVDAGNATVAELQIFYLQQAPGSFISRSSGSLDDIEKSNNAEAVRLEQSNKDAVRATQVSSWLSLLFGIGLAVGIAYYSHRSITRPLATLMVAAHQISDSGDLDQTVQLDRDDEIGQLARSFNNMIVYLKEMAAVSEAIAGGDLTVAVEPRSKNDTLCLAFTRMTHGLREIVRSVRDSGAQVASGSTQVAEASEESAKISVQASSAIDEVTSTMHEMSVNVQNMVKNTQTQASSVSETSASIDEMVASIQRVADTAKVLLDISHRSREEVQTGISTMEKTTDGLSRINQSIQASGEIIDVLGQRADDIGKIIEVIDDLAEQTNLLALNAAIEAARAGEHGLGFAVVADEVRKLAEKSAQSTKEISDLIQSIQKEARKAVEHMEKSTGIVNEGLTLGSDLNGALKKISNVVTEVYKFAQEIGAATNEQSHGSSQIAKATTRLNEITHEINSAVEEQASGAQAVVKAMEKMRELVGQSTSGSTELAASAEQMSKMSRQLLESMDRFVLELNVAMSGNGHGADRRSGRRDEVSAMRYAATARS
jgi:methyl-accepting chemotaxis protein